MTVRNWLIALVDSAFDRIDTSVPPYISPQECLSEHFESYRQGILETVAATFQTVFGSEKCWMLADLMGVSGFEKDMNAFIQARLEDPRASLPRAGLIVDRLLSQTPEVSDYVVHRMAHRDREYAV